MNPDEMNEFLNGGILLEAEILRSEQTIRDSSKLQYDDHLIDARLLLTSIAWELLKIKEGIPGKTNPSVSNRITLIMTYFQGISVVESLVSEGQYIKAAGVLKQDYELLTRIKEVKKAIAQPGKTPNVKHAPEGTQHFYGALNDVAHPSNIEHLQCLLHKHSDGDVQGVSCIPTFVADTATNLYSLHIWLLFEITREYILLMLEMYPDDEATMRPLQFFSLAAELVEKAGFIVSETR